MEAVWYSLDFKGVGGSNDIEAHTRDLSRVVNILSECCLQRRRHSRISALSNTTVQLAPVGHTGASNGRLASAVRFSGLLIRYLKDTEVKSQGVNSMKAVWRRRLLPIAVDRSLNRYLCSRVERCESVWSSKTVSQSLRLQLWLVDRLWRPACPSNH
jgi:site-specific recombinase XerC